MLHLRAILITVVFLVVADSAFGQVDLTRAANDDTRSDFEEYITDHAPSEDAFVAVERLAYFPIMKSKWEDAAAIFKKYEDAFPEMRNRFETIIKILEAPEEHLKLTNIGPGVNSSREEFSPVLSADGKRLYFTKDNGETEADYDEDIMVASLIDGRWQNPVGIGTNVNTKQNESVNGISADGNRILFFGNYASSFGRGDLFYADKQPDGSWGYVHHFRDSINTEYFEGDGVLTSDGKAMLFSSDRPGCLGGRHEKGQEYHGDKWGNTDIFVSLKQRDGSWAKPINLGKTINTPFSERKPFLHPDGKTLYFVSDGHPGLGMLDIFMSTRLNDTSWTEWSEPVNLGKEINNAADNFGFRVTTDGNTAYLSLDNRSDGYGGSDIYTMTMATAARPAPVATITGVVTDESGKPLDATIKWDDLESNKNLGELSSDPTSGVYYITVPLKKNVGYYADKPGYYPVSKNIDLRDAKTSVTKTENITLISIKSMRENNVAIRLNNLFFDFDRSDLKPESYAELDRLLAILKENPDASIEIGGHTDSKGSADYNAALSRRRSQSVVDYLIAHGCAATRLSAKGYGDTKPVANNDTDEGRAQNRRVEVRFTK